MIVIEQVAELRIIQPNAVRWEAVDAIPGQVAVLPSALLAAALVTVLTVSFSAKYATNVLTICSRQ